MELLKKYSPIKNNNISDYPINKKIKNGQINKVLIYNSVVKVIENTSYSDLIFDKELTNTNKIVLHLLKNHNDNNIVTTKFSKNFYKLYLIYFFNFLKKNKISLIKGRILNKTRGCRKKEIFLGIHGIIIKKNMHLTQKFILKCNKKFFGYKKKKKKKLKINYSNRKFKKLLLSFKTTDCKKNGISIKISRKTYLKMLHKNNATIRSRFIS